MTYDYSSESKRLELPNPYRAQNQVLWACAAVLVLAGIVALWWGREALAAARPGAVMPIAAGLGLLLAGLGTAAKAATRLRFFFGRGRPASLTANELPPGGTGTAHRAEVYKELLRQGALGYPEPQGAIDGLLYHWVPHLITAPMTLQDMARTQFFNLAALVTTLSSFAAAMLLYSGSEVVRAWIGVAYCVFTFFFLVRPLVASSAARLSMVSLVGLIAGAILGPVLIGMIASSARLPAGVSLSLHTTVMLVAGLVAVALTVLAVMQQVSQPPATQTSAEQRRLSLNVPPSMLFDEVDRRLQEEWVERIPNRRYARIEPVIDPARHTAPFAGEIFEETQPLPIGGTTAPTLGSALASPRHRWIVALDFYASALVLAATISTLLFVHAFTQPTPAGIGWSPLGLAGILLLVAAFCQQAADKLWGRFDFESVLIWVEMSGTYQSSTIGTGNALASQVNSQNHVIRTESMTLRVWRARVESVVFGKDGWRQVTAMFSTEREAKALLDHLEAFARAQSILVAPQSVEDQARLAALGASDALLAHQSAGVAALAAEPHAALGAMNPQPARPSSGARFCHACGAGLAEAARFCSACGAHVTNG